MYLLNHLLVTSSFITYLLFPEGDKDTETVFLLFVFLANDWGGALTNKNEKRNAIKNHSLF